MSLDPSIARRTFRSVEPIHGMIYFSPDAHAEYTRLGLKGRRMGYFASRSAAMGAVPADVVVATFFNFSPQVIRPVIPAAWAIASPEAILEARLSAADSSLRSALGTDLGGPGVEEAATLARRAAERACERPEGRPLFAGHASLPWPDEAHLVLWHAETLLREFRGDGHVGVLMAEGLDPVEVLVIHAATGEVAADVLRATRAWDDAAWDAGVERVRGRGWLESGDELTLTPAGRGHRQAVEDRTDRLAVWAYEALGEEGCARLRQAARPLSRAVIDSGLLLAAASYDDEA
jgi:hypothetical protein